MTNFLVSCKSAEYRGAVDFIIDNGKNPDIKKGQTIASSDTSIEKMLSYYKGLVKIYLHEMDTCDRNLMKIKNETTTGKRLDSRHKTRRKIRESPRFLVDTLKHNI